MRRVLLLAAAWIVYAALGAGAQLSGFALSGSVPAGTGYVVWSHVTYAIVWAAATPLVFAFARRHSFARLREPRSAAAHLAALMLAPVVVSVPAYVLFNAGLGLLLQPELPFGRELAGVVLGSWPMEVVVYLEVLAVAWASDAYRAAGESEVRATRLRGELASARVEALKAQLHPHFLFNALNSLMPLISTRPAEAERTLRQLGELLRQRLESTGPFTTLRTEVEFLSRYLDIQRTRYGDRLGCEIHVSEGAEDAAVPALLLQPLVENAIRHGLAPRVGPGRLEVRATRAGERLVLEVLDDGLGLRASAAAGSGVGLVSTRRRLAHLYAAGQSFSLEPRPGGGTAARIELPFQRYGTAAA